MASPLELDAMKKVLEIARKGQRSTFPNPMVGAIVFDGNNSEIGSGYHTKCGFPHAEIEALRKAGSGARGGTLVVTLEPCCHSGRTGPCTSAIIEAGISRVVIAMKDPDLRVSGKGIKQLTNAGIEVELGLLRVEAEELNSLYLHYLKTDRSRLRLKTAVSLDGRIAASDGTSRWITGDSARRQVHHIRACSSAILTGGGTIRKDDPQLTVRHEGMDAELQPARIIITCTGDLDLPRKVFETQGRIIIAVLKTLSERKKAELKEGGAVLWEFQAESDRINLKQLLKKTAVEGYGEILCECGSTLASELLKAELIDRMSIFTAPVLLGSEGIPAFGDIGVTTISDGVRLTEVNHRICGNDILTEGEVVYGSD